MKKLPKANCESGYSFLYLKKILDDQFDTFVQTVGTRTMAMCTGRVYNFKTKEHTNSGCGPHGPVIYEDDVREVFKKLSKS